MTLKSSLNISFNYHKGIIFAKLKLPWLNVSVTYFSIINNYQKISLP